MIYLELFFAFFKVSCFAFGGAYGAIPLIREMVLSHGWLNEENLTYMIAVSESTPGPIMVNLATYIGSNRGGFFGAVTATTAVVLPAYLIVLLITALMKNFIKNKYVQAILQGVKPCVTGIILATGVFMVIKNCFGTERVLELDISTFFITVVLAGSMIGFKKFRKRNLSPITIIVISALLGILLY